MPENEKVIALKKLANKEKVAASLLVKKQAHQRREGCCYVALEKQACQTMRRLLLHCS